MSNLLLMGVGQYNKTVSQATSSADTNPYLNFFENFPGHLGAGFNFYSNGTLSFHAVNIPLSISFNKVVMLLNRTASLSAGSLVYSAMFGLYSMTGGTLSLANSASGNANINSSDITAAITRWVTLATSATQVITPGQWYFAFAHLSSATNWGVSYLGNSSINPGNAIPGGFLMGRMTASTNAMPGSIATSDLDITGSDATRQPYIIITA